MAAFDFFSRLIVVSCFVCRLTSCTPLPAAVARCIRLHYWPVIWARVPQLYPIGIPVLYALILWKNRHSLNPRVQPNVDEDSGGGKVPKEAQQTASETLGAKLVKRSKNPDLMSSMFLWKDFSETSLHCRQYAFIGPHVSRP